MILFVQLIVVNSAVGRVSIDMVVDDEVFVSVHKNSWKSASLSSILPCGHMKQACPFTHRFRQILVDNHIIFNFEFIAPIREGPDIVTSCQGYFAIDGEDSMIREDVF